MPGTQLDKLIAIFEKAQQDLIKAIRQKSSAGSPALYKRKLLKQVTDTLTELKSKIKVRTPRFVKEYYQIGLDDLVNEVSKNLTENIPSPDVFSKINRGQINLITENMTDELITRTNMVGRRMRDEIRSLTLDTSAQRLAQGQTVKEMAKTLERKLLGVQSREEGKPIGVTYSNNKTVRLPDYAKMAARTTTAEIQNTTKIIQGNEYGLDIVHCTKHFPTCKICARFQDLYYATTREAANGKYKGPDGEPLKFPYLYDTVFVEGYDTIHPNCIHRFVVIVPRAYTPEQLKKMSVKSMKVFDSMRTGSDVRSIEEQRKYNSIQAENRERRRDLKQYERYKLRLGDEAPKSFAGFRRMKVSESDNWIRLQERYREADRDLEYISIDNTIGSTGANAADLVQKEINLLSDNHNRILYKGNLQIEVTDTKNSKHRKSDGVIEIRRNPIEGETLHEMGHAMAKIKNIYNNPEFEKVLIHDLGTDLKDPQFKILLTDEGKELRFLESESKKFISIYQKRIYDRDDNGRIWRDIISRKLNPMAMREYFSEGFREYYINPENLEKRDKMLYDYIAGLR